MNFRSFACAAAILSLGSLKLHAQYWNVSSGNWNAGGSWMGGSAPLNNGTADTIFDVGTTFSSTLNVNYSINSLTVGSGAGALTLSDSGSSTLDIANGFYYASGNSVAMDVPISGTGVFELDGGTGTVTLNPGTGSNTYSGNTYVNSGGTLSDGEANSYSSSSVMELGGSGSGTLLVNFNESIAGLQDGGTNAIVSIANGKTLTLNGAFSTIYSGVIADQTANGALTLDGPSQYTFKGANTYTGLTTINTGGGLNIGGGGSTGSIVSNVVGVGTGSLSFDLSVPNSYGGVLSGTLNVVVAGTGATTLSGVNTYSGPTTIFNGSSLKAGSTSAFGGGTGASIINFNGTGTLDLNGFDNSVGSLSSSGTSSTVILGTHNLTLVQSSTSTFNGGIVSTGGGLTLSGAGTQILGGSNLNSYTGATVINTGTLSDGAANSFSPNSDVRVNSAGGSLHVNFNETVGNLENGGTGGPVVIASGATLTSNGDDYTLMADFEGAISGSGNLVISTGVQGLAGNNSSYSGVTTITNGGELFVASDTALGTNTLIMDAGTELSPDANVVLANPIVLSGGATLDNDDGGINNLTLNGVVSQTGGVGNIEWCTTGTLTLTNSNTFTGGVDMRVGNLVLANNYAAGMGGPITLDGSTSLTVMNGVTVSNPISLYNSPNVLTGNGTIASAVIDDSHAVISPSASPGGGPGNLTFSGGLTLANGGAIHFDIYDATGTAGTGFSLISATGGLGLNFPSGSLTFNIVSTDSSGNAAAAINFNPSNSYSWVFATSPTAITGTVFNPSQFNLISSGSFLNGTAGGVFGVTEVGNSLYLNFTPVPEPSTWALMGGGMLALAAVGYRGRRHSRA